MFLWHQDHRQGVFELLACYINGFGADKFVQSMHQWYLFLPDPFVFRFIASVLLACQTLVIPSPMKYEFMDTFVQCTKSTLDRIIVECSLQKPSRHIMRRFDQHMGALIFVSGSP